MFDELVDDMFEVAHDVFGADAFYVDGDNQTPITVIRSSPEIIIGLQGNDVESDSTIFEVPVSQLADVKKEAEIHIGSEVYVIQKPARRDDERRNWTLEVILDD
tara:strand:- start:783 stop:1094 length:312 start_codon:yes stop_codon:yes gene_type:complete